MIRVVDLFQNLDQPSKTALYKAEICIAICGEQLFLLKDRWSSHTVRTVPTIPVMLIAYDSHNEKGLTHLYFEDIRKIKPIGVQDNAKTI